MKGQAGVLDDVRIDVALHQEWVSHHPFGAPELRSSFTPRRVEIRDGDGTAVAALDDPRPSFSAQAFDTPWTRPQLAYFVGTAMWTYLTQPFCFALPGFRVEELPARRVSVDGTTLPTRHRVHPRGAADRIDTSDVIVSIDIDDTAFGQL